MNATPPAASPLAGLTCLVLAHDNPAQLRLLLTRMGSGGARCLVHLDPRASSARRELERDPLPSGARLLPRHRSRRIAWGGFAMVEATLAMMREALADPETRHLCLLSGAHLPIRAPAEIAAFLFDGREHIDLRLAAAQPPERESLRPFWHRGLPGREAERPLLRAMNRNAWRLGRRDLARGLRGMTPMVGSQWWHMTAPCARHLLAFLDANPWYGRFFRGGTRIPDEGFFQTLVSASPYAGAVGEPPSWQRIEAFGADPIGAAELAEARASGRPFARKFDIARAPLAVRAALEAVDGPRVSSPGRGSDAAAMPLPDGLSPLGGEAPLPRPGEILALLVTRNEALRLPCTLRHLAALGVDRALVVDNRSTDGTREIAARHGSWVHVFDAPGSYAGSNFGVDWTNALLDRTARGHWVLVVDADELLVFPGCDHGADLRTLCAHLDATGSEALRTILLDLFPSSPLREVRFEPGDELLEAAPWFEPPALRREPAADFPYEQEFGGLRERVFFPEADPRRPARMAHQKLFNLGWRIPTLREQAWYRRLAPRRSPNVTKVPLLRWREGARLIASTHMMAPMAMAPEQPSGVLLHFKYLQDFHARAEDAVARGAHFDGSREYRRYLAAVGADPGFRLHSGRSLRYAGADGLVALGLMRDTDAWREARAAAAAAAAAAAERA